MWPFNRLFKAPKTKTKTLRLLSCQIHGSHYYDCLTLLNQSALRVGKPLQLRREPNNEYDTYAIEVYTTKGVKLGYVPKQLNQVIATLMDQGCQVEATIEKIVTAAWEPVTVQIDYHHFTL